MKDYVYELYLSCCWRLIYLEMANTGEWRVWIQQQKQDTQIHAANGLGKPSVFYVNIVEFTLNKTTPLNFEIFRAQLVAKTKALDKIGYQPKTLSSYPYHIIRGMVLCYLILCLGGLESVYIDDCWDPNIN